MIDKLYLMGRDFKIVDCTEDGKDGSISYKGNQIEVSMGLCEYDKRTTLLHEIMHSVLLESGVHYYLKDNEKEMVCEMVAGGLQRVFNDNKHLLDYLKGE